MSYRNAMPAQRLDMQTSIAQLTEATLELKLRRELRESNLASHTLGTKVLCAISPQQCAVSPQQLGDEGDYIQVMQRQSS